MLTAPQARLKFGSANIQQIARAAMDTVMRIGMWSYVDFREAQGQNVHMSSSVALQRVS
jgi:hypothetical protein